MHDAPAPDPAAGPESFDAARIRLLRLAIRWEAATKRQAAIAAEQHAAAIEALKALSDDHL